MAISLLIFEHPLGLAMIVNISVFMCLCDKK